MIRQIALHEFLFTVKRRTYLIFSVGMPLFLLGYAAVATAISLLASESVLTDLGRPIAIVDRCGVLVDADGVLADLDPQDVYEFGSGPSQTGRPALGSLDELQPDRIRVRRFDDLHAAQQALLNGAVRQVVVLPPDYLSSGRLDSYVNGRNLMERLKPRDSAFLQPLLRRSALQRLGLSPGQVDQIERRPNSTDYEYDPDRLHFARADALSRGLSQGLPFGIVFFLILGQSLTNRLVLSSTAADKESKIIDVLLSSVRADELMFGKVLGQLGAGLLQLIIWVTMVSALPLAISSLSDRRLALDIDLLPLILAGGFVVLGCLFYGCLVAGLASFSSNQEEGHTLTRPVRLCAMLPLFVGLLVADGEGPILRAFSLFPLFSPTAMMLRLAGGHIAWWDVGLAVTGLLLSIWLAVRLSGKMFRLGSLMSGQRPSWSQILSLLRQPM